MKLRQTPISTSLWGQFSLLIFVIFASTMAVTAFVVATGLRMGWIDWSRPTPLDGLINLFTLSIFIGLVLSGLIRSEEHTS